MFHSIRFCNVLLNLPGLEKLVASTHHGCLCDHAQYRAGRYVTWHSLFSMTGADQEPSYHWGVGSPEGLVLALGWISDKRHSPSVDDARIKVADAE